MMNTPVFISIQDYTGFRRGMPQRSLLQVLDLLSQLFNFAFDGKRRIGQVEVPSPRPAFFA